MHLGLKISNQLHNTTKVNVPHYTRVGFRRGLGKLFAPYIFYTSVHCFKFCVSHRYHYQACTADMLVVEDNDGNTLSFSCLAFLHCAFSNGIMMAMHYLSGAHVRVHDLNIWHLTSWAGPQFQSLALRSAQLVPQLPPAP